MNTVKTQKTYKGKTAGQWLRGAKVAEMQAGTFEIVAEELPGHVISEGEFNTIVIAHAGGAVAQLELSPAAIGTFRDLRHQRGQAYYAA